MTDQSSSMQTLYTIIKQDIIDQDLKPGQRLPERELAERYNVSRTPIRQVLQQLSMEGLVEFIPYKGAFIKDLTIEDFKDITQLRAVLEKLAVEICCESTDKTVGEQLEHIISNQQKAIDEKDVKEYTHLDQEFHHAIVKASTNKELEKFIELLNQKSYLSRVRTLTLPGQMERSIEEHRDILKYILLKDKESAGKKAAAHVEDALQRYIEIHNIITKFT
ncbi:GntR family transcriptional regulator [Alkalihalobacillus oceani]|uniref:GntR family transcriptional regulator n=1 Tax=Halalkalibacter oceani TaxID=1653776 RepID=A0A9X2IPQ9_9BACI|nr:GntR family transcriptional regulator [Halalkalibacter oceani]MCM3716299.1 GntR family transcriptional regulator [Halalkalibacter oceani]